MNQFFRMRRANTKSKPSNYDVLFPQAITSNVIRAENGGVLESFLLQYDRHLGDRTQHFNSAVSTGTNRYFEVRKKNEVLVDCYPLLLTLHTSMECEPYLKFNDGEFKEIISASGDRIPGGQAEGTTIFLVWNANLDKWILMSADNFSDITKIVLPVQQEYNYEVIADGEEVIVIPGFNKKSDKLSINYGQTILRYGLDYEYIKSANDTIHLLGIRPRKGDIFHFLITNFTVTAKRGHFRYELKSSDFIVPAKEDGQTVFDIPKEADGAHSMVVNYGQTILRNNLDYDIDQVKHQVILKEFSLGKDEELVFTITQFMEAPGELVPNNWGATGNYRYKVNVIHGSYVATEDNVAVFPVPQFNYKRDDIALIDDNHLLIYDVDYTIDEIGNVVLLKKILNTDDEIFFTILQGGMVDVPNFNVIKASGQDGQHILVDMSYSVLSNYYCLLVKLKHGLLTAPTLKCVDGPAEPICDCFHTPVPGGYKAGSYLWLVYDEGEHLWYSLSHSQVDITQFVPNHIHNNGYGNFSGYHPDEGDVGFKETVIPHGLGMKPERIEIIPCEPPTVNDDGTISTIGDIWSYGDETNIYVGNSGTSTSKFKWSATTEDYTNDLRSYIDHELDKIRATPGKIQTVLSTYTAESDGITAIENIKEFNYRVDKLMVNFGQTVLREDMDYTINKLTGGIDLINGFELSTDDILQFVVVKQKEF